MNAIKEILVNGGYITATHHSELAADFPRLVVCIKWGQSHRELSTLGNLNNAIADGEARGDYVREVFVPVTALDKMREAFGITDEDVQEYYKTFSELMSKQSL
jgi:hypothetical protein